MSSALARPVALEGVQTPRIWSEPTSSVMSRGREAVEIAAIAGLHLDPWQQFVLEHALGERADGKWAAFEVGLIVSRQNGKGSILEALELAALFIWDERLVVHTAHQFKTSHEHFLRIWSLIENCDQLRKRCKKPKAAHGEEQIETLDGQRLRFLARSRSSGRGFTGDRIVLDEAFKLDADAMSALLPTLSAVPNPQIWYTSSAPLADSSQLKSIRDRGRDGMSKRLAYFEWSAPADALLDLDDRAAWAAANPAMGYRIPEEFIEAELDALREQPLAFACERLGISEDEAGVAVIPTHVWSTLEDPASTVDGRVAFAIDTTPDHGWSSIAASGLRPDGLPVVDVVEHRPGTQWVVERVAELVASHRPVAVVVDPTAAAGSLLPDFAATGVPVVEVTPRDVAQACGAFFDAAVDAGTLRHLGQSSLNTALLGARQRPLADAWAWDRKKSADICPLVAATLAFWGFRTHQPAEPGVFFLDDLDLDDEGAPVEGL